MNDLESFHNKIFSFYAQNKRNLPWRNTTNRYEVMVSEFMLQQTQVSRVIPKYLSWLQAFTSPAALAAAPLREVLLHWQGLGYNNRAQRLQAACQLIVKHHKGIVPGSPQELIALPGIGPYMARSIPIFSDNLNLAAVDTNIRRIFIHEFDLPDTMSAKELQALADSVLPQGKSRDWHNALMDYGALKLTARTSGIAPKTKQSTFKGSKRYYRSSILRLLLKQQGTSEALVKKQFLDCPYDIDAIIDGLVKDNLLVRSNGVLYIKS